VTPAVIASEAKQSMFPRVAVWIASSLTLPCANALRLSQAMTDNETIEQERNGP
jgi:hypothetical protein